MFSAFFSNFYYGYATQLFDRESYTYTYMINDQNKNAAIIDPVKEQFERIHQLYMI